MYGMLLAERAILVELETVGVVLLVLHGIVVSLLAFAARQGNFYSHDTFSLISSLKLDHRSGHKVAHLP